jgi:hypothetical protein
LRDGCRGQKFVQITAKTKTTRPRDGHESVVTGLATSKARVSRTEGLVASQTFCPDDA